jgi:4-hydroxy-2-oxoheptanedioate aldolase
MSTSASSTSTSGTSTLSRRLRAGETGYTAWCTLPAPLVVETVAQAGFSSIVIDQQHGLWDTATTLAAITAVRQSGAAAVVRVPVGAFATVSRVLDFGADAVIAPMINSAQDARALVAAAKYPPVGERSWGPARAMMPSGMSDIKAYLGEANGVTLTFAMIETAAALEAAEAIAATDGIDALFVGPWDLSITLSHGADINPLLPAVDRALDRVLAAAAKAGKFAALYCTSAEEALAAAARGFRFVIAGNDYAFLRTGTGACVEGLRARKA